MSKVVRFPRIASDFDNDDMYELDCPIYKHLMELTKTQEFINAHPKSEKIPREHWDTIRHNIAFLAAEFSETRDKKS